MTQPDFSALRRWPNVPACYGWLSLDRRGRWRMRGEAVTHRGLNDFLSRQYTHDEMGNYFVQNGPQRVFVELEYTPWVLHLTSEGGLGTHIGDTHIEIQAAVVDDEGNLLLEIPQGIALLCDRDLPALLQHLQLPDGDADGAAHLLAASEGRGAEQLLLAWQGRRLPVRSLCRSEVPARYGFVASPQAPLAGGPR